MNIQESPDIDDTVRISSRCFEVSPCLELGGQRLYVSRTGFTGVNGALVIRRRWTNGPGAGVGPS